MGVFAGPEIVEDGLVLALDAGNTKSYPGSGATWNDLSGNENDSLLRFTKFNLSRNNFTIEGWVRVQSNSFFKNIITKWNSDLDSPDREFIVRVGANFNQIGLVLQKESTGTNVTFEGSTQIASNTWHHFAIVRNGNNIDIYLNGTKDNGADTFDDSVLISNAPINIATINQGSSFAPVYISNLRVINGVALYTSNFTPSTTPLQSTPETVLLTCQNSLSDSSSYNWNIQNGGSPTVTVNQPNTGFGSIFFDGTDDYSFITKSEPVWNASGRWEFDGVDDYINCGNPSISSGKITVNAWVKLNVSKVQHIVDSSNNSWHLAILSSNIPYFWNGTTYHTTGNTLTNGVWYMLTGVQGTTLDIYVNGILNSTIATSPNISTNNINLGRWQNDGSRLFNGNIAQVSIYNRALTASEIQQNFNATRSRFGL